MYSVTDEIFEASGEQTVFGKTDNTLKNYRVFVSPVRVRTTRRGNQTINTMRLRKRGSRRTVTTRATTIAVAGNRTITIRTNKCSGIVAMASQTTNTSGATVAVICSRSVATITVGYFYLLPSIEFLASSRAASSH